jgi:enterobacteria phage integrase
MSRPRSAKYKSLPPNLYWDKSLKIYRYRRPDNGKFNYFGKDRAKAVSAAKQINSMLMESEDLVAKVLSESRTLNQYIDERFIPIILPDRGIKPKTLIGYKRQLKYIKKHLGGFAIHNVSVMAVADFLATQKSARQSNKYRGLLILIFKYAKADGLIESNPADSTLKRREVKQRDRLKLNEFKAIYQLAGEMDLLWLQNAMDIGMLTLQRESDILNMKFSDVVVETLNGKEVRILQVIQQKTEKHGASAHIKIKISQRLDESISRCRQKRVVSPFLISRQPMKIYKSEAKKHHTQILPNYFCGKFAEVRDATKLFDGLPARQKPTFHEIRSLAIKCHEDAGYDAQALAGHTTRQMTEYYKTGHEVEWTYADSA